MSTYSTHEAAALADVTYRRVDYWVRAGKVTPSVRAQGSGSRRRWTEEDIERLRDVKRSMG